MKKKRQGRYIGDNFGEDMEKRIEIFIKDPNRPERPGQKPDNTVDLTNLTQKERGDLVKRLNSLPVMYQIGETKNLMVMTSDILIAEFINRIFGEPVLAFGDICPTVAFVPDMVDTLFIIMPSSVSEKTWCDFESVGIALAKDGIVVKIVTMGDDHFSFSKYISYPNHLPMWFKRVKAIEKGRSVKREGPYDNDIESM